MQPALKRKCHFHFKSQLFLFFNINYYSYHQITAAQQKPPAPRCSRLTCIIVFIENIIVGVNCCFFKGVL